MKLDASRLSIAERDIEDYLYEHPELVDTYAGKVARWIKRQLPIPSGRLDLLGITNNDCLVVVEIKNTDIDAATLTQVSRYASDIEGIGWHLTYVPFEMHPEMGDPAYDEANLRFHVYKAVVGTGISTKTKNEAYGMEIAVNLFRVKLELEMEYGGMSHDEWEAKDEIYTQLASDPEIETGILTHKEYLYQKWIHEHLPSTPPPDVLDQAIEVVEQAEQI